ncbi:TIGR02680 family protein [Nocardiopsis rhodophaea]|uniref:TIGR02680 family protein n=1 Tax=Nocardiopsis rhodophaea TaxID=280238 RepID=A0ABP5ES45_9ACTN
MTETLNEPDQAAPVSEQHLPRPGRDRWQPLRIGLVDMFYYETEEFWFRDGRLLLRGNNGTGKSKVLALSLPFLLDGDLSARRVEPDGDPKKRMEWNLLLGGEHPHPERLGYTWIEFGRLTETGTPEFRTLGCGLKAVSGRGIARSWFFVTRQRVDMADPSGFRLVNSARTALTRDRLIEVLGEEGRLYDTARDYRRAVDEELFGLGEERYKALVDLLIQLRQPQLSKRPDEAALSRALTEALPPMDQAVVADAADAFRSLDEERDELESMADAERAAARFLTHYRSYAQVAAYRRARAPRERNSDYEGLREDLRAAEKRREDAQRAVEAANAELAEQRERSVRLDAEKEALRAGPEARSARELDQAAETARRAEERTVSAARDAQRAAGELTRVEQGVSTAQTRAATAATALDGALRAAGERAQSAGIGDDHGTGVEARVRALLPADAERPSEDGTDTAPSPTGLDAIRRAAESLADRRDRSVRHVEELLDAHREAERARGAAEERLTETEEQLAEHEEQVSAADEALEHASAGLVASVREHLAFCAELRPDDAEGLLDLLQEWTDRLDGPNPARAAAEDAAHQVESVLADTAARLRVERTSLASSRDALRAELNRLREGGQSAPPLPHTRDPAARDHRPGAPLWKLVDFNDDISEPGRAGLEAALEASGLLDAWVTPDGTVEHADTHDVLVAPDAPVNGTSLSVLLHPAIDPGDPRASAVGQATVARVLAAVGAVGTAAGSDGTRPGDDVPTWVATTGAFRVGVLRGRWAKDRAEYLGEGAREAARRARIAQVEAELDALGAQIADADTELGRLAERTRVLKRELADFPRDEDLRAAHARLTEARRQFARMRTRRDELAAAAARCAQEASQALDRLHREADDLRLPTEAEALGRLRAALVDYRIALAELWPSVRERREALADAEQRRADAERYRDHAHELAERAAIAGEEEAAAKEHHETLRATVGAAVAELQRRLEENDAQRRECRHLQDEAQQSHSAAIEARGRAEGRIDQLRTDIDAAAAARTEAISALRRFTATGLLGVALPDLETPPVDEEWAARPAVELARAIDGRLAGTDDSDKSWERVQKRLSEELNTLRDTLSERGHQAIAQSLEDGMVVRVVFQGREREVPELADALAREVEERKRILSAREREILENHLITEVAGTLQELIVAAERQVATMNAELNDRPTSTGMLLRLVWRPSKKNAPPGLEAATARLRQDREAWAPEDREAMGEFLQAQIDRVRSGDQSGGTWLEHLTAALDYRSWHEFGVERHQHGRWHAATGPASGGERVLSMSVPLFAAASSHYASAGNPHAPRLITLDEAFAGVDDDARAKCLGLLASFDLDVVMTSEREWGCYPEVPGLSIAQLSRVDDIAAVLVTRWEWDGRRRTRAEDPESSLDAVVGGAKGAPAPSSPDDSQAVLWP